MVLSNKKLKQKLRSLLADSIAASETKKSSKTSSKGSDINEEVKNIKELLISKSRKKPKSEKPSKPRKQSPLPQTPKSDEGSAEPQGVTEENAAKKEKKKSKKRKREDGNDEAVNEKNEDNEKKEKKKPKQKKKKKKKEKVKNEEEKGNTEGESSVSDEKSAEEPIKEVAEEPIKIVENEIKKVYVGGIPYYSTEDDIKSFFEGCGTVTEVDCLTFPETGKFRGIAFLTFKTEAAAKRALNLDGADMGGFYLKVQPYKAQRTVQKTDFAPEIIEGYNRAYVGNLSWDITEDDLKQFFSDCKISSIKFGMDKDTGDFKGYAHVDFADSVSLTIALKLDQQVVCERPVRIRCAVPKKGGETNSGKKSVTEKVENVVSGGKKKRRTCYECGVPGHLSSACPKKKANKVDGPVSES